MKKIYGFLGAAALLMMVGCSKDDAGGAQNTPDSKGGDMFMSLTIAPTSSTDSRTQTGNTGTEVGKDYENEVKDAVIILATLDQGVYKPFKTFSPTLKGTNPYYSSVFEVNRDDVAANTYYVFVVANPGGLKSDLMGLSASSSIQKVFELAADADTYWSETNGFLMTNADVVFKAIGEEDIAKGKHTTESDPLNLGTVKIQRAMSRFDIDVNNLSKTVEDPESTLKDITFTFDAVALVNQATKANLFKVTSNNTDAGEGETNAGTNLQTEYEEYISKLTSSPIFSFNEESVNNYVFSPVQEAFTLPLYSSSIVNGKFESGDKVQKNLAEMFTSGNGYLELNPSALPPQDNEFEQPTPNLPTTRDYRIFRYCMENTNYDKDNQFHGNTTGIVFRAKMSGTNIPAAPNGAAEQAIYAFNEKIYGTATQLRESFTSDNKANPTNDLANIAYYGAIDKYVAADNEFNIETATTYAALSVLDAKLVENGFTIYRPDGNNYYSYYLYWNRHNDNGTDKNTIMGPMEFATVRNNIYKLSVTKVSRLGHPGDPNDDPDPDDPGDEDEKDHLFFSVECEILKWVVRGNDIEF